MPGMFFSLLLVVIPMIAHVSANEGNPCPQINYSMSNLDPIDGVPMCPEQVGQTSPFAVYRCAIAQAKEWHPPTNREKALMGDILDDWNMNVLGGLHPNRSQHLLEQADGLGLQGCRVRKGNDSFMVLYTKPKIRNYSGPFLMLRETKPSNVLILSPHDGVDGTHSDTKIALMISRALAVISNGHKKGITPVADFSHHKNTLGNFAQIKISQVFPKPVVLQIHGMRDPDTVLYRTRFKPFKAVWEAAWRKWSGIKDFNPAFNADFTSDYIKTPYYLKAEIPARLHLANKRGLGNVIREIEKEKWAWPEEDDEVIETEAPTRPPTPAPTLEPTEAPTVEESDSPTLAPSANELVYAPVPKGNRGVKKIACVAINYSNNINDYMTAERCLKTAKQVAAFYDRNSGGKLKLIPAGYQMNYTGDGWKVFEKAAFEAKKRFDADYYIVPSVFRKGGNHASGGIAWMSQLTKWVVQHEVGHLLGMPHSGRYIYGKDGNVTEYQQYGDDDSPMGNNGFKYLTGPEYYGMGWLDKEQVALYQGNATQEFVLTQLDDGQKPGNPLVGVLIRRPNARDAFISYPVSCKGCVVLHLTEYGTKQSMMVKKSNPTTGELYDEAFTGLHIKVLEVRKDQVRISVDYNAPE